MDEEENLNDLVAKIDLDKKLLKLVLEFLKEDGEIIEKRKDLYKKI